jgi:hypothetical protein
VNPSARRNDALTMPFGGRSFLKLPIRTFEVLRDGTCDLALFVFCKRSPHAANEAQPVTQANHHRKSQVFCLRPHVDRLRTYKERYQVPSLSDDNSAL